MQLIINGVTLDGDLMDADFMEKFESSMIKMRDSALASKSITFKSAAEAYRAQCTVVDTCFDDIFGPGTAAAIFKGKTNVREHLLAIEQVNEWAAKERKELNDLTNKYTQRQQAAVNSARAAQFVSYKHGKGKRR